MLAWACACTCAWAFPAAVELPFGRDAASGAPAAAPAAAAGAPPGEPRLSCGSAVVAVSDWLLLVGLLLLPSSPGRGLRLPPAPPSTTPRVASRATGRRAATQKSVVVGHPCAAGGRVCGWTPV